MFIILIKCSENIVIYTVTGFGIVNKAEIDCVDHNKLENSEGDGNTRPPDLPLEKPICRSGSNS